MQTKTNEPLEELKSTILRVYPFSSVKIEPSPFNEGLWVDVGLCCLMIDKYDIGFSYNIKHSINITCAELVDVEEIVNECKLSHEALTNLMFDAEVINAIKQYFASI